MAKYSGKITRGNGQAMKVTTLF